MQLHWGFRRADNKHVYREMTLRIGWLVHLYVSVGGARTAARIRRSAMRCCNTTESAALLYSFRDPVYARTSITIGALDSVSIRSAAASLSREILGPEPALPEQGVDQVLRAERSLESYSIAPSSTRTISSPKEDSVHPAVSFLDHISVQPVRLTARTSSTPEATGPARTAWNLAKYHLARTIDIETAIDRSKDSPALPSASSQWSWLDAIGEREASVVKREGAAIARFIAEAIEGRGSSALMTNNASSGQVPLGRCEMYGWASTTGESLVSVRRRMRGYFQDGTVPSSAGGYHGKPPIKGRAIDSEAGRDARYPTVVVGACPLITNLNIEFADADVWDGRATTGVEKRGDAPQGWQSKAYAPYEGAGARDAGPGKGAASVSVGAISGAASYSASGAGAGAGARRRLPAVCRRIARAASERGGGVPRCESMALPHGRGRWEVAVNLNDPGGYTVETVLGAVCSAADAGVIAGTAAAAKRLLADGAAADKHESSSSADIGCYDSAGAEHATGRPTASGTAETRLVPIRAYEIGLQEVFAAAAIEALCSVDDGAASPGAAPSAKGSEATAAAAAAAAADDDDDKPATALLLECPATG